jgi:hypothetical protein
LIIQQANNSIKLLDVLKSYNLSIDRSGHSGNWSVSVVCPFPNHKSGKEKTASFGYNYNSDKFHCFGCNASGGSVEFIALKERRNKLTIAEEIIRNTVGYIPNIINEFEDTEPKIEELLFDFSNYIYGIVNSNRTNLFVLDQINKITWWFDSYLMTVVPKKKIIVEELAARISKSKEILDKFRTNE